MEDQTPKNAGEGQTRQRTEADLAKSLYGRAVNREPGREPAPDQGAQPKTLSEGQREIRTLDDVAKSIYGADGKPADKPQPDESAAGQEPPPVVSGEYRLTLPAGREVVDQALMGEFTTVAQEFKLGNDQAQKLTDLHMKGVDAAFRAAVERVDKEQEGWRTELRNDTIFGGALLNETVQDAKWTLDQMGSAEEVKKLKQELNISGLGDHPVLIKGLARLARQLRAAGVTEGKKMSVAERMFGSSWTRG